MSETKAYAFALVAVKARELREALDVAARHIECHIVQHRMAEVRGECEWCESCFGDFHVDASGYMQEERL